MICGVLVALMMVAPALGWQDPPATTPERSGSESTEVDARESASDAAKPDSSNKSARTLVEEGNRRFRGGQYDAALESYDAAKEKKPDALEVEYDRAISALALGRLEEAREAFERVTLSPNTDLAENAMYGLGACDHAEALAAETENPQDAVGKLEQAMRRYHDVLSANPDHKLARDANYRAGTKWRQIKEMLQQQQQQQQGNEDQEQSDDPQEQEQQQQQGEQDQQKQDQQQEGDQQQDQQQAEQQQESDQQNEEQSQDGQDQQKQQSESEPQQDPSDEQEAQPAEEQEDLSREQAARELRRLMDQMRERKQERRQPIPAPAPPPLEKDW